MSEAIDSKVKELDTDYLMHTFGRKPVEFVRGEGVHLYDAAGTEYLDFLAGIAVCSLGHCNPALTKALQEQAEKLIHVSNYFYIEHRGEAAKKISELLNYNCKIPGNWKCFFTNSGAESNECALKIARFLANKKYNNDGVHTRVVVLKNSFHGRTLETLAATAQAKFHVGFEPISPVFLEVEANDCEELKKTFDEFGESICAMICEPVQGESGVHPMDDDYIKLIRELTIANDALMIMDEVQTGVYRSGMPFAFQYSGVVPDVVTIAKGIASGFPCGVCAARGEAAEVFGPGDHGTTFGGSNLACAAIDAVLDELARLNVLDNVNEVGPYMVQKLEELPQVKEVRGSGLMLGAELKDGIDANAVVLKALTEQHLVINATGPSTLRFLPPLIITKDDVDEFIEKLSASF